MEQIVSPRELAAKLSSPQNMKNIPYRFSKTCMRVSCGDGELWFNTLTGELLHLNRREALHAAEDELREALVNKWFLVPEEHDEYLHGLQMRRIAQTIMGDCATTDFTVFPTTDCNARCFYCYELGRPRRNMSVQTARDAADYIDRARKGKKVTLHWFGGEPLFNIAAIRTICARLKELEVEFDSKMVSNGYLFDENIIITAVNEWHLSEIQITLDGTEDVYNKAKAYIDKPHSAYRRVMKNIGLLLDAGVRVSIRLNMNRNNAENLHSLGDELAGRFGGKNGLSVYAALLRDFGHEAFAYKDECAGVEALNSLQEHLVSLGIGRRRRLPKKVGVVQCMADDDRSVTILPDGRIGKCEHESDDKLIGSIYDTALDREKINEWKQTIEIPECRECVLSPMCVRLRHCAWNARGCRETDRFRMRCVIEHEIRNEYELFLQGTRKWLTYDTYFCPDERP